MTGNGFSKEKARSFLQKLNKPLCFLEVFSEEKEKEYKEVAGNGDIKDIEELRLFIEIHERFQFIFEEFVEN